MKTKLSKAENKASSEDTNDGLKEVHQLLSLSSKVRPNEILDLGSLTKLDLPGCHLSKLPDALPTVLPNLSILFLSNNDFEQVPPVIGACKKLQMVAFKANKLTSIHPEALQSQLRWLILTDNKISVLPDTIGRCKKLQKFMLSGNLLSELPHSISLCHNLELIRLSSNRLEKPPMTLLSLPNLSWVALSGNPFIQNTKIVAEADKLKLSVISDIPEGSGEVLGMGAGGITRKVAWKEQLLAVKTFCGAMTSDGSPEEERRMSLTVSSKIKSEFLISLLGETPSGSLVMEYLENYSALAGPPSLDTCSRDVYSRDSSYMAEDQAISMVSGLLEVLEQLHWHGMIHGDFYAHNILVSEDDRSKVKLGDFGAAFFYDAESEYGAKLQQTELRAFGHFVNEVQVFVLQEKKAMLQNLVSSCREESASFFKVNKAWKEAMMKS